MNSSRVIIVKQKWDEDSHFSKVKRVFFNEDNAVRYINEQKLIPENDGCFWIISDREISDYVPCISDDDIRIKEVEAQQELISTILDDMESNGTDISIDNYLDKLWGNLELFRLKLLDNE